ncbi:MAG: DUF1461 domain-containing protein [Thiothrix sp.]|uniref:lipoprotein intramolecular transacylase Lit n=1 Tax=Thiothrix sp. TaxID=1032 RepID=UPI002637F7D0|nr:DUF1461 domain-containing protein [Thiothrix sp.]MDD5391847.1 DUF1461 domain-containing protein [Thiothrix sp.]
MLSIFHLLLETSHPTVEPGLQALSNWLWDYLLQDPIPNLPNTDLLDMRSRRHMLDVKRTLLAVQQIWYVASSLLALLVAMQIRNKRLLVKSLYYTSYLGLGVLGIVGVLTSLSFRWSFNYIHQLLFTNQSWVFSLDSALIQLFPIHYFQQFFIYWSLAGGVTFLLLLFIAKLLRERDSSKN